MQVTDEELLAVVGRLYVEGLVLRRDLELARQQATQAPQPPAAAAEEGTT